MLGVTATGELLIDFTCLSTDSLGYPTMAAHPGGAPASLLAALSKFGAETAMPGRVGNDSFGRLLVRTLQQAGIETRGLVRSDTEFTTLAFVTLDETGNREFSFARKPLWDNLDTAREQLLRGLAQADVMKISDEEVKFLFGLHPEAGAACLLDHFPIRLVFVTCGPGGCYFRNAAEEDIFAARKAPGEGIRPVVPFPGTEAVIA